MVKTCTDTGWLWAWSPEDEALLSDGFLESSVKWRKQGHLLRGRGRGSRGMREFSSAVPKGQKVPQMAREKNSPLHNCVLFPGSLLLSIDCGDI